MTSERIRVLVIDDSAFTRRTLVRMLEGSPLIEVVGWARDGEEALRMALETDIDLITLDLEMPRMDGFTFLRIIMAKKPTPVIVVSGRSGDQDVFRALDLGAVDFLAKPSLRASLELRNIERELIRKVHAIRQLRIDKVQERLSALPTLTQPAEAPGVLSRVVAIGASTGGPTALMQVFSAFAVPPPCAFIVSQHMPTGFTQSFAARIDRLTSFRAQEAETGLEVEEGMVMVAPGGSHLEFETRAGIPVAVVVPSEPGDKYAPAVDRMFESAAKTFGSDLLGIVLTGMGDDGRRGALAIREAGGRVLAESEETAVIFGMPQQVIRSGAANVVARLGEIPSYIQAGRSEL